MPIYTYRCPKCSLSVETVRTVADIDLPPSEADLPKDFTTEAPKYQLECQHEFERQFGGSVSVVKGRNWGGGKGQW